MSSLWFRRSCAGAFVAAVAAGASAAPAAETPVRGGIAHIAAPAEPPTLDWMSTTAYACREVAWNVFEQIYTVDRAYRVVPMLADGMPQISADGRTVRITLRRGVRFHDGSIMTAADAAASIERWGRRAGAGKAVFAHVARVAVAGDDAVVLTLRERYAPLIADMADLGSGLVVIPKKIADAAADAPLSTHQLVGTGPYRFDAWLPGQVIRLKRFDGYVARSDVPSGLGGKKVAYLDEIDFELVKDQQVRLSGLQSGQYEYADDLSQDALAQVQASSDVRADLIAPYSWNALVPNKAGVLGDVRLRRAIALALDRGEDARAAFGPPAFWQLDGALFFPEQRDLYTTAGTAPYRERNIERAKALVKAAGYDGKPLVYMTTKDYPWMSDLSQAVVPQLQAIGLNVDLQTYDWPTILAKRNATAGWDLFGTGFNIALDPTAIIWTNPKWAGFYRSPAMDALLARWSTTTSAADKRRLIVDLQRIVYADDPIVKIANVRQLNAYSTRLHGYESWMDYRLWNTWLTAR